MHTLCTNKRNFQNTVGRFPIPKIHFQKPKSNKSTLYVHWMHLANAKISIKCIHCPLTFNVYSSCSASLIFMVETTSHTKDISQRFGVDVLFFIYFPIYDWYIYNLFKSNQLLTQYLLYY